MTGPVAVFADIAERRNKDIIPLVVVAVNLAA